MEKNLIFKISSNANPNYLATICKISKLEPIKNADRLVKTIINGYEMVVSKEMKEGQTVVYFPLETSICQEYLSSNNCYSESHADMNANYKQYMECQDPAARKLMCGFFSKQGRVRIVKLRGIYSMGYVAPVETLFPLMNGETIDWENMVGKQFDMIGDTVFCWKFINEIPKSDEPCTQKHHNRDMRKLKRLDKVIPGQFEFHYDTIMLNEHIDMLNPEDEVDITVKIHGTSGVFSNVLCNKRLNFFQKIAKKFGWISGVEYGNIYSSHHTIKNRYYNSNASDGFYEHDIWTTVNGVIKPFLNPGMTIYGEIMGYVEGTNSYIQKNHDYGCAPGQWKFMPYRITETDEFGNKKEWDMQDVIKFCKSKILSSNICYKYMTFPTLLYHGLMKDLYPEIPIDDKWYDNVLAAMKADKDRFGMELNEPLCKNKVPREGIVIRKVGDPIARAWKLKTAAHYAMEGKQHDAGEVDIEEIS